MEQIRLINLEDEKPTVKQAMDRLELELRLAKKQNVCVLKIIHGFGSTGNGGGKNPRGTAPSYAGISETRKNPVFRSRRKTDDI